MATHINIRHVNHLTITPSTFETMAGDLRRGVSVEAAQDIDPTVPDEADIQAHDQLTSDQEAHRVEMLAQLSEQEQVNAEARRTYLVQLVKEVGKQRQMEGFAVNHDNLPNDREAVEAKNFDKQKNGQETLNRACGKCAWAGTCKIRNNLPAWTATHYYANSDKKAPYTSQLQPQVKKGESRMKFLKRLDRDPLAHCIPEVDSMSVDASKKAA